MHQSSIQLKISGCAFRRGKSNANYSYAITQDALSMLEREEIAEGRAIQLRSSKEFIVKKFLQHMLFIGQDRGMIDALLLCQERSVRKWDKVRTLQFKDSQMRFRKVNYWKHGVRQWRNHYVSWSALMWSITGVNGKTNAQTEQWMRYQRYKHMLIFRDKSIFTFMQLTVTSSTFICAWIGKCLPLIYLQSLRWQSTHISSPPTLPILTLLENQNKRK